MGFQKALRLQHFLKLSVIRVSCFIRYHLLYICFCFICFYFDILGVEMNACFLFCRMLCEVDSLCAQIIYLFR